MTRSGSRQLVSAALQGEPVPRVPTGPLAVHYCAGLARATVRSYTTQARVLAESVIRYYERFKPDAVWVSADTWVSAEAMGARVGATGENQPFGGFGEPLVGGSKDLARIPKPSVESQGRYPLMLEALTRVVEAVGQEAFVVACFDQYPFSLAAALAGISQLMLKLADDPPFVHALMERCEEYALAYAHALSRAGADMLSGGDSPAGLLGPRLYAEFTLPYEQRLVSHIKERTAKPVSLHICGNAHPILPLMKQVGSDVLELDHAVDLAGACATLGPGVALWGNLDPVRVLAQGTPRQVRDEVWRVLRAIRSGGHKRFVLSSGCTLAMETPSCNMEAFFQAAEEMR